MSDFGVIGLGVMGQNLALNIEEHGFSVAVWNLETEWTERFVQQNAGKKITGAKSLDEFVKALRTPAPHPDDDQGRRAGGQHDRAAFAAARSRATF